MYRVWSVSQEGRLGGRKLHFFALPRPQLLWCAVTAKHTFLGQKTGPRRTLKKSKNGPADPLAGQNRKIRENAENGSFRVHI